MWRASATVPTIDIPGLAQSGQLGFCLLDLGGKLVFAPNLSRQTKATTNAYNVARKFRRITRLYYYQWRTNNATDFFDAGIIDFNGNLRPAYGRLKKLPRSFWR